MNENHTAMRPILNGFYAITDDGRLFSFRSNKFLSPSRDKYGYLYYVISINGVRQTLKAHRLVALAFIKNPKNKPTVNHKNGIRDDNRIDNLEWATEKEQLNDKRTHDYLVYLSQFTDYQAMGAKRNFGRKKTAVYCRNHLLGIYDSLKESAAAHHINYSKASECANGLREEVGGVRFCYV